MEPSRADVAQAATLYRKACDAANADACMRLGTLYEDGNGVTRDYDTARGLYQKACDAKFATGCYDLSRLYYSGMGVPADRARAHQLLRLSCQLRDKNGCSAARQMDEGRDPAESQLPQSR